MSSQFALTRWSAVLFKISSKKKSKDGILGHSKFEALGNSNSNFYPFLGNKDLDRFEEQIWNLDFFEIQ